MSSITFLGVKFCEPIIKVTSMSSAAFDYIIAAVRIQVIRLITKCDYCTDNEHLGRLKSNCCCIYTRPRVWDDPTTWEQDEAELRCRQPTSIGGVIFVFHLFNPRSFLYLSTL
ncbi:unnamed protein product [Haemonchus placei]|uniref:E3 ubiquitin-protein ligase PPP1R11 n=1 Tax=Haemonchus placei TaxID=6290 RepID=A0A0N4WYE1_HAEPC|nr:unnamed protein product [Haemonchus placei]